MASTKTPAKNSPAKPLTKKTDATAAKPKPAPKTKVAAKPAPAVKPKPAPKAAPRSTPKAAGAKPAKPRAKKPAGVPSEQRRHYVEMAAYYIAERRGFAPGNPLEDWVQAETEIDRLLAEGRLGG
jgi:outer membrane biosynthesis protein TonB